jgi:hypothetical protein
MTPKEKAKNLVDRYSTYVVMWSGGIEVETQNVKQCALIAVDEMLTIVKSYEKQNCKLLMDNMKILYWHEVKQEIEKL